MAEFEEMNGRENEIAQPAEDHTAEPEPKTPLYADTLRELLQQYGAPAEQPQVTERAAEQPQVMESVPEQPQAAAPTEQPPVTESVPAQPQAAAPTEQPPVTESVPEQPQVTAPAEQPPQTPPSYGPAYGAYTRQPRGAYADAGYVPASDAGAMPRSYYCATQTERRPKKEKRARRGMRPAAVIALCLVCAILGGAAAGFLPRLLTNETAAAVEETAPSRSVPASGTTDSSVLTVASAGTNKPVTTTTVHSGSEMSATDIYYNLALKQVVGVKTEITYTNVFGYTSKGAVSGSGFIISEDGYILTNHHVIEDAVKGGYDVQVLLQDGTSYIATVVGYEEDNDVAVLKIDAAGLSAAVIGDSDAMQVGERVYAVGNPLGELEYTMTDGMVSALDREISSTDSQTGMTKTINMFQISAAINSGNSGGPIYNARGEVIGIATAKYSDTGVEGLGFAIPINDAVRIAKDLINDGYVRGKAYMGINVGTVTASAAQYYGLVQGAIVASVEEGSCAAAAGLKESDIIVAIDGKEILSGNELISAKKNYRAGDSAVLKVYRDSQYIELTITFDEATPERLNAEEDTEQSGSQSGNGQYGQNGGGYGQYGGFGSGDDFSDFFNDFFGGTPFGR